MIIQRYYMKEFFRFYLLVALGLSLVLSLFDLMDKMEHFTATNPTMLELLTVMALVFPRYLFFAMPMSALFSSLFIMGRASKLLEIVAIMAAGGRLRRIFMPFVLTGVLLSIAAFGLGEIIVPLAAAREAELTARLRGGDGMPSLYVDGVMWLRTDDGSILKIDYVDRKSSVFRGVSVFQPGNGSLDTIIRAEEARFNYEQHTWMLINSSTYDTAVGTITHEDAMPYASLAPPDTFMERVRKPHEMGMFELRRYINRIERAGFEDPQLTVEYHSKISFPLINLFMVLIGLAFAMNRSVGGLKATAIGILVSVGYWFGFTVMLTVGYAGILPPFAAVWVMPAGFAAVATRLYMKIAE